MASQLKLVMLCDLCEKVYDPNRDRTMKINSRPSWGTTIEIQVPLHQVGHPGRVAS